MAEIDFVTFASGAGANVITQASYTSLAATTTGFQSGIATSAQCNKVWRQSSIISSVIAQFIAQQTGQNVIDDGTTATILANFTSAVGATGRTRATGLVNLYVNPTTGNDSNSGINTSVPFATIQAAYNKLVSSYDLAGYQATINLANGTYSSGLFATAPVTGQGGPINIIGSVTSPSSVIVNSSASQSNTFWATLNSNLNITGMYITSSGTGYGGYCLVAQSGGVITHGSNIFGAANNGHIISNYGGYIECSSSYTISGGAPFHLSASLSGPIGYISAGTITVTGTPNFTSAFAFADGGGQIELSGTTFSGTATGQRFLVQNGGYIQTSSSANQSFFPGNVAGVSTTGYYQ